MVSCVPSVKVDWEQRAEENFLERKYSMRNEVFKRSSEVEMKFLKGNSQKKKEMAGSEVSWKKRAALVLPRGMFGHQVSI